ncbi:hypothetical protein [Cupriavidus sp. AcVe19-6a]|uniref:hypothetical protein n=1 Tax=Cupriavidus sp. AcVe19-6a TaxID=2821358 RepID=UPI001AEB2040|nr:hypothetical protein [Cupriavidus sp. AcVe19-6a]MBP0634898.1 hypothetical protein [Cupriavidus sp. AcVe19-6a]
MTAQDFTREFEQMITALGRMRRRILVERKTTSCAQAEDAYNRMLRQVDHAALLLRQATFAAAESEHALQKQERYQRGLPF